MPELTAPAVEQYTAGRLDKDDPETIRLLSAALVAARRWCGWHVTPVQTDTLVLDGPGGRVLRLPTLALESITSIDDDGTVCVPADLYISSNGVVSKRTRGRWSRHFGSITATFIHGIDSAPDFDAAVLSLVDRESVAPTGGRPRVVGPFQYDLDPLGTGVFTLSEQAKLEQFRLERPA
jgi:hypothetical protein